MQARGRGFESLILHMGNNMDQPYVYIEDQYPYPPVPDEAAPEEGGRGVAVIYPPPSDKDATVIVVIPGNEDGND